MIALDRKHREIAAIVVDETNSSLEYLIVNHVRRKLGSFELAGRIGEQVATGIARSELAAKLGMSESALSKYHALRKIREADRNEILGMVSEPAFELLYSLASARDERERAAAMASIREGEPVRSARARRSAASGGSRWRKVSPLHNRPAVDPDTRDMGIGDFIRVFQNFIEFGKNASPVDDENSRELAGLWRPVSLVFARYAPGSSVLEGEVISSTVEVSEGLQPSPRSAGVDGRLFSLVDTRAGELLDDLRDNGSWPPGLSPRTALSAAVRLLAAVNTNVRNQRGSFRPAYSSGWA
jgi:hypothetical protein